MRRGGSTLWGKTTSASFRFETPTELHSSAYGKAILAHLSNDRIERVIDEYGLPARTENTVTTKQELYEELKLIRERGFSLNDGEEIRGVRAIGAPIRETDGSVLGANSVSKTISRMKGEEFKEVIPEQVKSTVNGIEINTETSRETFN